ncbi:hypothetical protein ACMA1D_07255 [Streptomyces sp. 796.1]|uniref:hypothetical protein n=1 Tax=Streptomyces sp. 796.1 TaxID=3163029 RepID=UPI0039C9584B
MPTRRSLGTAVALSGILGSTLVLAPAASATPAGCGDLSKGSLCVKGGKIGSTGTYTWRVRYVRHQGNEITVRLGSQRKDSRITAWPLWFGSKKTRHGVAELRRRHEINRDECIRGVMEYRKNTYYTKWRCP